MRYYLIAGEASGDLHGSNLIKELKKLDTTADMRCWGGDKMEDAGAVLVKHYKELAFMGFAEVIKNLPTIFKNLSFCKKDILLFKPDVLILIDYPGFNLRIAKWAKQQGLKVIYYISPQVWAWKESRVKQIKQYVDKMIVILPFEKEFYKKWNYDADYVGHPLVEVIEAFNKYEHPLPGINDKPVIALLPGSRKQELSVKLPIMLQVSQFFPDYQFVVAKASSIDPGFYDDIINSIPDKAKNISSLTGQTYELLSHATAALVTSGTATLETALFHVPQIVCYKGSEVSYQIAKRLIKLKYISLVNLIMDKEVVRELIQHELTVDNIRRELNEILNNKMANERIKKDYESLTRRLSQQGTASEKAARIIYNQVSHIS